MKKIGEYTVRGTAAEAEVQMIQLFDGSFETGYRVVEFYCAPTSFDFSTNADVVGKLCTTSTPNQNANEFWNWADNTEIAWAGMRGSVDTVDADGYSVVDPDNLIVEDLYFVARSAGNQLINYMVVLEKYEITDWQGALALSRDRQADSDGI